MPVEILAGLQERDRIDRAAVDADFVMEMAAGRTAGRAHQADDLAALHAGIVGDEDLREVAVARLDAAAMVDLDEVAVAALAAGMADDAVGGRVDRRADRAGDVDAGMHRRGAAERIRTDAEAGGEGDLSTGCIDGIEITVCSSMSSFFQVRKSARNWASALRPNPNRGAVVIVVHRLVGAAHAALHEALGREAEAAQMAGGLLVAGFAGDAGLAGERDLARLDSGGAARALRRRRRWSWRGGGELRIDRGAIGLAREHGEISAWRFSTRGGLELGGFLGGGDIGLHLRDLRAHLRNLRLGRALRAVTPLIAIAPTIACARHSPRTARSRRDAGEQRLGAAGDAETAQIAAVVENEIAGGEKIAEPLGQVRILDSSKR
jgi:hypothetical protein